MTTVTTAMSTSASGFGGGATIVLVVVLLLVGFVVATEIVTSVPDERAQAAGRVLGVGAIPLLIAFATIIATKLLPFFGAVR